MKTHIIEEPRFRCEVCGTEFKRYPGLQLQIEYDNALNKIERLEAIIARKEQKKMS